MRVNACLLFQCRVRNVHFSYLCRKEVVLLINFFWLTRFVCNVLLIKLKSINVVRYTKPVYIRRGDFTRNYRKALRSRVIEFFERSQRRTRTVCSVLNIALLGSWFYEATS